MAPMAETVTLGKMVPLGALFPSPLNPRKKFDSVSLNDLRANIQKHGVIVPLLVRAKGARFEVIDGERRYRAVMAADAGLSVPVIERNDLTDGEVIEIQLLSAIQRQELTPLEEAGGFKALIDSNQAKYSAGYIAERIGRTERFVWDRMQLLKLIPDLKRLLEAERILVGHAELLAKLKPEDQARAIEADDLNRPEGGLWEREEVRLKLDDDEDDDGPTARNLYRGLKPVTVKELESWIAHHVRFDVAHMATTAPLDFAATAQQVAAAQAEPGKGKKVIAITHECRVDDDAKDPHERTYGSQTWQRADGQEKSKTCEHSVLGTFVAGPGYGTTLRVCINRDKCTVHFADVIKDRERNQKLRQQGKGGQAAQREAVSANAANDRWKREQEERQARRKAWEQLAPHIFAEAVAQVKAAKTLTPGQVKHLEKTRSIEVNVHQCRQAGLTWHKQPIAALLVSQVQEYSDYTAPGFDSYVTKVAKPLGLDLKRLEAVRDTHAPTPAPAAAAKTAPAKAKTAKKAKKR